MWKPIAVLVVAGVSGGLYYFTTHYEVKREGDRIVVDPRPAPSSAGAAPSNAAPAPAPSTRKTIRIATFNPGPLDRNKLRSALVAGHLADLIRDFDVVAIQNVMGTNQGIIRELVDRVNSSGRQYDFAVNPEVGTEPTDRYSAFVFDRASVDVDRATVCLVDDPAGRFRTPPLVGLFRARGPNPDEAFTFMLVNVTVDPERAEVELDLLDDVVEAVRKSHPEEDDVILLGDLDTDQRAARQVAKIPNVTWAVSNTVSTTRGTRLVDNLVFDRQATVEFTGRANVVDLIRRLNLNIDDAVKVAEHMPVWAEFSVYEGGEAGYVVR